MQKMKRILIQAFQFSGEHYVQWIRLEHTNIETSAVDGDEHKRK